MTEFVVHSRKGRTEDRLDSTAPTEKLARDLDYQTPERVLEPVRRFFGGPIPFDPATALNNPTQANAFCALSPEDLALTTAWFKGHRSAGLDAYLAAPDGEVFKTVEKDRATGVKIEHQHTWRVFANDGLRVAWQVPVFVNPPYGGPLKAWLQKIGREAERVPERSILALLPASRFEQSYFHRSVLNLSNAHCYVLRRLAFKRPSTGEPAKGNPYSSILYGFNVDLVRFYRAFKDLGTVLHISQPAGGEF